MLNALTVSSVKLNLEFDENTKKPEYNFFIYHTKTQKKNYSIKFIRKIADFP